MKGLELFSMSKTTYEKTETYIPQKLKVEHLCDNPKSRKHIPSLSMHEYKLLFLPKKLRMMAANFWDVTTRNLVKIS